MTKVVFETAALTAAVTAAARVAPTRGTAFEKAAGVLLDITADECIVMATDELVRYSTWITPEFFDGEPVVWRLPSRIFPELLGKLKSSTVRTVELENDKRTLNIRHGRTRASFHLMDETRYARWHPFSPDEMTEVTGLAKAVSAVAWAVNKTGDPPLIGVHLDGENVLATNRYRFASVPCKLPLEEGLTVPPSAITSVLKNNSSVMMRVEGHQIYIMPDEYTQISLTAYGTEYPPIQTLMRRDYPVNLTVKKQDILDTIDLALTMTGADRMPTLHLIFGQEELAAMVRNEEVGLVGHVMPVPGQVTFRGRHKILFEPDNLMAAINGSVGNEVRIGFDPAPDQSRMGIYFTGEDQVEFWIAPRQEMPSADGSAN